MIPWGCCSVTKSCLTLRSLWTVAYQAPLWEFPGKNTGVGCHSLLQEIFPTQGSNPCLLDWQADSLPLSHQGSPNDSYPRWFLIALRIHGLMCKDDSGKDERNNHGVRPRFRLLSFVFLVMQGSRAQDKAVSLLLLLRLADLRRLPAVLILKIKWAPTPAMSSRPFESPPPYRPDEL